MPFRMPRAIYVLIACVWTCLSLQADRPQVMIFSRFWEVGVDGTDVLSAPRITTLSGQQATIRIGQESDAGETFNGIYLSVKPTVRGDKVSLVGVTFVGKQTVGEEGVEGKAKEALALLAERQGAESGKPNSSNPSFADEIELRGMFRMKGKPPRISLKLRNGVSFWIELGQVRSGIKLIHVDLSDDDSHAILEKGGRFARVDLKEHTVSDVDFAVALDGGGHAFRQEMKRGQPFVLALDGDKLDGKDVFVEILVEIIDHEKP